MTGMLARFFRWNNSRLITTDNLIVEKILKIFLFLSLIVYRKASPSAAGKSCPVTIRNFDLDLTMRVDRCRSMGAALFWTGFHEFREFQFLHRYLKRDMVFVDIGANLGEYSLFAAKRLTGGKVLAFEPLPSIRSVLEENIRLNGFDNIEVFPFGLSSHEHTLTIHEFEDVHEGLATFFPGDRKSKQVKQVPLKRMDDVLSSHDPGRIDFVKIDIEGGELNALKGCRTVIARYRPVFMVEVNHETYQTAGYSTNDVLDFFANVGYKPFEIRKRGTIARCEKLPLFDNILFMPE